MNESLGENAMLMKSLSLAAALALAPSCAALAQTGAVGGSAERNMNNPGSVKSNSEKATGGQTGPASTSTPGGTGSTGNARSTDGVTGNGAARAPK